MINLDLKTILLAAFAIIVLPVLAWVIIITYKFIHFVSLVGEKLEWIEANPIPSAVAALIIFGIAYAAYRYWDEYIY